MIRQRVELDKKLFFDVIDTALPIVLLQTWKVTLGFFLFSGGINKQPQLQCYYFIKSKKTKIKFKRS